MELLELFAANRDCFSYGILSNGSFIDSKTARRLKKLGTCFVQVSIEGTKGTHEKVRGPDSYEQAVTGLKNLVRHGVPSMISFTAHRDNYREFGDVAELGRKLKVSRVWADRLIPCGSGSHMENRLLTPEETEVFFEIMRKARDRKTWRWFNRTEISMHRALQFQAGGGRPYSCSAGDSLITVQANGDLYPCRRMPVPVGNLTKDSLKELYDHSDLFRALRDRDRVNEGCETCFYSKLCRGGLKCLSFAITGDPFQADPGCPMKSETREGAGENLVTANIA